jgi:gas vesicle protein
MELVSRILIGALIGTLAGAAWAALFWAALVVTP